MKNPLASGRRDKNCEHRDTITGSASGIQRVVCKNCGHVSVSHIGEGVTRSLGESPEIQENSSV